MFRKGKMRWQACQECIAVFIDEKVAQFVGNCKTSPRRVTGLSPGRVAVYVKFGTSMFQQPVKGVSIVAIREGYTRCIDNCIQKNLTFSGMGLPNVLCQLRDEYMTFPR